MAEPIRINFGTESHPGRSGPDSGARHINAFVENVKEGASTGPIYAPGGLSLFSTVSGGGACRGVQPLGSQLVAISGAKVVTIDLSGTATDRGGIPGSSYAFMARNANTTAAQVAIVVDGTLYVYQSGTLTQINDSDLPPPNSCTFSDQRIILSIPDGRIFWTDIDDATAIDALSFASAEGHPDGLVRVFAHKLDVWCFGAETTEIFRSSSSETSPFQRVAGGFIPKGCAAPHSVAALGDMLFFVGHDFIPQVSSGYQLQPLAHPPVCRAIESETDKTQIMGFTYAQGGHEFYVLSGTNWSWQFNKTTGKWFERKSYGMDRWRAQFGSRFGDKNVVGDSSLGLFYEISTSAYDENGADMVWTLQSPPVHARPNRISVDRLHINVITGVGLNSTDEHESDPKLMLRWSDDGGRSWSRTRTATLGALGAHETRCTFNNLGMTGRQGRIWELSASAPVVRGLIDTEIEGDMVGS